MKVAICSDEYYPIHDLCIHEIKRLGHSPISFGAIKTKKNECFASAAKEASLAIARKECDEGIFFCYSGTGICIVANKFLGIRAALCLDAKTASDARILNDANVLALSNRLTSAHILKEILCAWFSTSKSSLPNASIDLLKKIDSEYRKKHILRFLG